MSLTYDDDDSKSALGEELKQLLLKHEVIAPQEDVHDLHSLIITLRADLRRVEKARREVESMLLSAVLSAGGLVIVHPDTLNRLNDYVLMSEPLNSEPHGVGDIFIKLTAEKRGSSE
jgi:hypothetical protein